jgi:DNA invertase Pin-like site-specific DNA recombinase
MPEMSVLLVGYARVSTQEQTSEVGEKKLKMLHALYADKSTSVADILATLNISKSTLHR